MARAPFIDPAELSEHALVQEYGPRETYGLKGPVPEAFRVSVGKAIMAIAGADGELSEKELRFHLGRARQFGVSAQGVEDMMKFDYRGARLEDYTHGMPPSLAKVMLYDAILVAWQDGFAAKEREAARRWAKQLGLDVGIVQAIEAHLEAEDGVRRARLRLLAP